MTTSPRHHGRLRIYLGASPGVGKTFAMLEEGHRLTQDGVDIVVGYVEDHGRQETRALITGLELVPRLKLSYRDRELEELDVDAIAHRRPAIVLIDELAHTNAPGSRRQKRWQDVVSLLELGIDVVTTLNIQHIEELADVVESVTGVAVRETVPDKIIEMAHEIRLVDLPADAIIERLEDGKIYPLSQSRMALEHFFTVGNLTALRELALRRTADGVNEQLADLMLNGNPGMPETHDCVVVMLDSDPRWGVALRKAWRLSSALHSPLVVLQYTPEGSEPSFENAHLRLAEDLGAKVLHVHQQLSQTSDPMETIERELKSLHCTMLVIQVHPQKTGVLQLGRPVWREQKLIDHLARQSGGRMDIVLLSLG